MGSKQLGFGDYEQATAKKRTRRELFLSEMEKVVPSGPIKGLSRAAFQAVPGWVLLVQPSS